MKDKIFLGLLLVALAAAAPAAKDKNLVITKEFFPKDLKIYEGQHDIVKIFVPINKLNFDESSEESEAQEDDFVTLFFVEADINGANRVDQGLYVKTGETVKKLLDHGRDIAAAENSNTAYFAAKDGIYSYDAEKKTAVKYGNVDDDLIGIVMKDTDSMYVLSADKKVYKISEDGNKKEKIDDIKNAEQIVIDYANNIYYVDSEKKLYVVNTDGVKHITGLPENYSKIILIRPPFVYSEGGIPLVVDRKPYTLYGNGTLEEEDIEIDTEISAYSVEAALIIYLAKDKKIYEYNILAILLSEVLEELSEFVNSVSSQEEIRKMAGNKQKSIKFHKKANK